MISWYVHCNALLIWTNYSAASLTGARMNAISLEFCLNEEITSKHFFLSYSSAIAFLLLHLCCMHFFLPTSACRKCFFKITPPSLKSSKKRSAPKGMFLLKIMIIYDMHGLWPTSIERPSSINPGLNRPLTGTPRVAPLNEGSTVRTHSHIDHLC